MFELTLDNEVCKKYFPNLYFRNLTPDDSFKDKPKRRLYFLFS